MQPLNVPCVRCAHSYSFHGKSTDKPCKAIGCRRTQPDGQPCPGFLDPVAATRPLPVIKFSSL